MTPPFPLTCLTSTLLLWQQGRPTPLLWQRGADLPAVAMRGPTLLLWQRGGHSPAVAARGVAALTSGSGWYVVLCPERTSTRHHQPGNRHLQQKVTPYPVVHFFYSN